MDSDSTPHRAVFNNFFTQEETEVFRDFLQDYLPPTLFQCCDLSTLQITSDSFIDDELRPFLSDILYSLKVGSCEGYIYCLIDYHSTSDKLISFRLMRYIIEVMQQHLRAGHEKLPLVIPILLNHEAKSTWQHSMNWLQGFGDSELARQIYSSDFPLVDLTVMPDDEKIELARKMLSRGLDVAAVAEITSLTVDELQKLH